jgi:hypothetical protein
VDLANPAYNLEMEAIGFGLTISMQPNLMSTKLKNKVMEFASINARGSECVSIFGTALKKI